MAPTLTNEVPMLPMLVIEEEPGSDDGAGADPSLPKRGNSVFRERTGMLIAPPWTASQACGERVFKHEGDMTERLGCMGFSIGSVGMKENPSVGLQMGGGAAVSVQRELLGLFRL
jgi:hypothetical protein